MNTVPSRDTTSFIDKRYSEKNGARMFSGHEM